MKERAEWELTFFCRKRVCVYVTMNEMTSVVSSFEIYWRTPHSSGNEHTQFYVGLDADPARFLTCKSQTTMHENPDVYGKYLHFDADPAGFLTISRSHHVRNGAFALVCFMHS